MSAIALFASLATGQVEEWGCDADETWLDGHPTDAHAGISLASGRDLDGDGIEDILYSGGVMAGFHSAWLQLSTDKTLEFTQIPHYVKGDPETSVALLRDFNGGGVSDVAIGVSQAAFGDWQNPDDRNRGRVYVFFGENLDLASASSIYVVERDADDLSDTDADLVIINDSPEMDRFGVSLSGGDFGRHDGAEPPFSQSDLAVGAPGLPDVLSWTEAVDCDLYEVEPEQYEYPPPPTNLPVQNFPNLFPRWKHTGKAFVFLGDDFSDTSEFPTSPILWFTSGTMGDPQTSHVITGRDRLRNGQFGKAMATVPNMQPLTGCDPENPEEICDPVGFDELLIGAPGGHHAGARGFLLAPLKVENCPDAAVHRGYIQVWSWPVEGGSYTAPLLVMTLDPTIPENPPAEFPTCLVPRLFGWSVAVAGDITGDGIAEFVIGTPGVSQSAELPSPTATCSPRTAGTEFFGAVWLVDGSTGDQLANRFDDGNGSIPFPFMLTDGEDNDWLGYSVASRGDFVWWEDDLLQVAPSSVVIGAARRSTIALPLGDPASCNAGVPGIPATGGDCGGVTYVVRLGSSIADDRLFRIFKNEHARDGMGWSVAIAKRGSSPLDVPDVITAAPRYGPAGAGFVSESGKVYEFLNEP